MAYNPDDPYRMNPTDDEIRRQARLESELQADPELAEGPASSGKVAMFAIAIAVVLGTVFYGLNNTSVNQAGTTPSTSTAQNTPNSPPAAPPGMRDVTPRTNAEPGTTTGAAPARPQAPPAQAPRAPKSIDRPARRPTPPASNGWSRSENNSPRRACICPPRFYVSVPQPNILFSSPPG